MTNTEQMSAVQKNWNKERYKADVSVLPEGQLTKAKKMKRTDKEALKVNIYKKKAININTVDVTGSFGRYVIFSKKFLAPKSQLILFNVKIKTADRKDKMMKFMTPIRILI